MKIKKIVAKMEMTKPVSEFFVKEEGIVHRHTVGYNGTLIDELIIPKNIFIEALEKYCNTNINE